MSFRFSADTCKVIRVNTVECLQGQTYDVAHGAMRPRWNTFAPLYGDIRIICKMYRTVCFWYAIDSNGDTLVRLEDDTFDVNTALNALIDSLTHLLELLEQLAGLGTISWNEYSAKSWDCFTLCDLAYSIKK